VLETALRVRHVGELIGTSARSGQRGRYCHRRQEQQQIAFASAAGVDRCGATRHVDGMVSARARPDGIGEHRTVMR